jgi:RNA polymerase sigma-32 factor
MLSAEEERDLLKRAQAGDRGATEQLMHSHMPLVLKHAFRVARVYSSPLEDMIQEGVLGLLEAIQHFDDQRGARLSTCARWWIRAFQLRHVLANWRMVRVGTTRAQREAFFTLKKEQRLMERSGQEPRLDVLAKRMGVAEQELSRLEQHLRSPELSFDAPVSEDDPTPLSERFAADEFDRPDHQVERAESFARTHELLDNFREELSARERELVERRWLAAEPRPLRQLGVEFGVSGERVRQLETKLIKRFQQLARRDDSADNLARCA